MQYFVQQNSIVRSVWGKSDIILFIFAGAAAEFALNKAVDWLYFTGKLPADPLARLFSTVNYARKIVFSPMEDAHAAIDTLRAIHGQVESNRGASIPDWAYRDVLFMLIYYSIVSYELLERKMSASEKEEVYNVFYRVGSRMGLKELPLTYEQWLPARESHLESDLNYGEYTADLFRQYKRQLGGLRYLVLSEGQKLVVPTQVTTLLKLNENSLLRPLVSVYKMSRKIKLDWLLRNMLLPPKYKQQIEALNIVAAVE